MKTRILGALLAGLCILGAPAWANRGHGDNLERMQKHLGLSDEQLQQLKPYAENMQHRIQSERDAFKATLTQEQIAKFEEAKKSHRGKGEWKKHRKGNGEQANGERPKRERPTPEQMAQWRQQMAAKFAQEYNLTAQQQAAFTRMQTAIQAERQAFRSQLMSVLTAEQQQKMQERKHRGGRHHQES
ncbi:MAG: hypothetical protein AB7S38_33675 [Vulcanimicrobiota bacterium]